MNQIENEEYRGLSIGIKTYNEYFSDDQITIPLIKAENTLVIEDGYTEQQQKYLNSARKYYKLSSPLVFKATAVQESLK